MLGKGLQPKNYRPVSLLSVVSKVFEKLVNNRIVDHLEKCGLFSDFQYGFRSSRSVADLLRLLTEFGMLVFLTNLSLMEFQVRYLALFLLFLVIGGFGLFWDGKFTIPRYYKDVYVHSFFPRTARLWNSLAIECFPLTYDLSGFKSRISRYHLTVGSF